MAEKQMRTHDEAQVGAAGRPRTICVKCKSCSGAPPPNPDAAGFAACESAGVAAEHNTDFVTGKRLAPFVKCADVNRIGRCKHFKEKS